MDSSAQSVHCEKPPNAIVAFILKLCASLGRCQRSHASLRGSSWWSLVADSSPNSAPSCTAEAAINAAKHHAFELQLRDV